MSDIFGLAKPGLYIMCCFLVPLAQAVATSIYRRSNRNTISSAEATLLKRNIPALEKMLWGGSVMLIVDHIINGELMWRFPFFSALAKTGGTEIFLKELLTVGVPMSLAITAVWAIWALASKKREPAA